MTEADLCDVSDAKEADAAFAQYSTRIRQVASDIERLDNIPMVKQQLPLILEVQTDEFWQDVTPEDWEHLRRALHDLVKLIEPVERKIVCTDFTDETGAGTELAIVAVAPGMEKLRFTMKVRRFIEKHKDHTALQKLRRAEQLTLTGLSELEKMFRTEGVPVAETEQNIARAFSEARTDGAMLIFDEADSLLADRRGAVRNWEVSQVNEMLTWMESHPLPFVCTTAFAENLDPATQRRFTPSPVQSASRNASTQERAADFGMTEPSVP